MGLRILHTEASLGWGGQEIRILEEAAGLAARGHEVRLAAPAEAQIMAAAGARGVTAEAIPIGRRNIAALRAVSVAIGSFGPDVIVTHSSTDSWLVALATAARRRAPPIVRTRHISAPVRASRLNRWLYGRRAARVVTTGESLRNDLLSRLGLDPGRVVSIPTGIDLGRFRPGDRDKARSLLGLPAGQPIIGIVATLRSWKGHRHLIEAMTDPRLRDAMLVIAGDGPQEPELRRMIGELGLAERIRLAGRQGDVVPYLQAFDLFALPSTMNEGVPQALMQAMACGLAVVTTPVGAIPELVRDGETGLLVAPGEPEQLAGALRRLFDDKDLAGRLAGAARRHVAARFSIETMLDGMERVLTEAAAAGSFYSGAAASRM